MSDIELIEDEVIIEDTDIQEQDSDSDSDSDVVEDESGLENYYNWCGKKGYHNIVGDSEYYNWCAKKGYHNIVGDSKYFNQYGDIKKDEE